MNKNKIRYGMLIIGLGLLLTGAIISCSSQPNLANFFLIAGAAVIIARNFIKQ